MSGWHPSDDDVVRVLLGQNPWRASGHVPPVLAPPTERELAKRLHERLLLDDPHRYQLVLGPRRVGKTTVMYQTIKHLLASRIPADRLWAFRLDHPLLLERSLDTLVRLAVELAGATHHSPAFVFLDELVYAKDWDLWLKTFYDERYPIRVVATSSATAALGRRRLESGVGRWQEQILMPYLFTEFLDLVEQGQPVDTKASLGETIAASIGQRTDVANMAPWRLVYLLTGGFPELLLRYTPGDDLESLLLESQRILRGDAIERAVYKDIPQSYAIEDPMALERLLYSLAGQVTGLISPKRLCSELRMSQPTLDRYVAYLERAFLLFALPNYSGREITVQKRGRRVYFVDTALRNAALERGVAPLRNEAEMGLLLENLVASQLHSLSLQSQQRLFHWRDGKDEVDLILDDPEAPLAFEVSMSADHHRKGLRALINRHSRFHGRCFIVTPESLARTPGPDGIGTLPLDLLLLLVGRQTEEATSQRLGAVPLPQQSLWE